MNPDSETLIPQASNPFANKSALAASTEVESQRAVAEVQAAMMLARRFPRDPLKAMDAILNACTRPTLAEGALYSYARGGTEITGPSIRLAEMLAQNWGNIQFGIRELEQRNGESTVEAFAWDVETNTRQVKVFQVPHIRYSKTKGNSKLTDPRDVYELIANNGARRLRACILGIIPGDVTEEAVKQCETTLSASADVSPDNVKKMLGAFLQSFGVTKEQIEKRIQRRIESIQPAQIVSLKKIYASLKDAMSAVGDWFETPKAAEVPEILRHKPPVAAPVQREPEPPLEDQPDAWLPPQEEEQEKEPPLSEAPQKPAQSGTIYNTMPPTAEVDKPSPAPDKQPKPANWKDHIVHFGKETEGKKLRDLPKPTLAWFQQTWLPAAKENPEATIEDTALIKALEASIQPTKMPA